MRTAILGRNTTFEGHGPRVDQLQNARLDRPRAADVPRTLIPLDFRRLSRGTDGD